MNNGPGFCRTVASTALACAVVFAATTDAFGQLAGRGGGGGGGREGGRSGGFSQQGPASSGSFGGGSRSGSAGGPAGRVTAVAALPCSAAPVQVNEVAFYQCNSTWFTRAYISGNVAYVVSSPPPGY
jgi:hypothetical protein